MGHSHAYTFRSGKLFQQQARTKSRVTAPARAETCDLLDRTGRSFPNSQNHVTKVYQLQCIDYTSRLDVVFLCICFYIPVNYFPNHLCHGRILREFSLESLSDGFEIKLGLSRYG
jgi:hypothetical protein